MACRSLSPWWTGSGSGVISRVCSTEGGVVKFLLCRGNTIPSPAVLNHNHERLVAELDAVVTAWVCRSCGSSTASTKRTSPARFRMPPRLLVTAAWCSSARLRSGPRRGGVSSTTVTLRIARATRTFRGGGASRRCPMTGTSTSPTPKGDRRSSSCVRMRRIRCGAAPTGTNGRRVNSSRPTSVSPRWTTGCARSRIRPPPIASVPGSAPVTFATCWRRMMTVLPDPLTIDDRRAGFDWSFSIAQLEVSDTAVFDQPRRARAWFEAAISAHLDLGRPNGSRWS